MANFDYAERLLSTVMPDEDWENDPHLKLTPSRFAKMLKDLTAPEEFEFTTFPAEEIDEMVVVNKIPFYTLCAHHVIPFHGFADVAYVPAKEIAGVSKISRTVQHFCKGLNIQEILTQRIHNYIHDALMPQGVAVVLQAEHLCVTMRGAQVPGTIMRTHALSGCFRDTAEKAREEFLATVQRKGL